MAIQWSRVTGFFRRLFGRRTPAQCDDGCLEISDDEQRREYIEEQVADLQEEICDLKVEISLDCDPEGGVDIDSVRQRLIRSRDLRYKVELLRAELERSFPDAGLERRDAGRVIQVEETRSRIREVADRILQDVSFRDGSERTVFETAVRDLCGPSLDKQRAAVMLLEDLRMPECELLYQEALTLESDRLQESCLNALAALNESSAIEELEVCLDSPDDRLRLAALRGVHNLLGPAASSVFLQCLADLNPEVRRSAARYLGSQESAAVAPALTVLLRDESVEVRVAAAQALEILRSEQTVCLLIRALEDEEVSVRAAAKSALVRTLSMPLDIDVHQDPDILLSEVETLLRWWSEARTEGLPWSAPVVKA